MVHSFRQSTLEGIRIVAFAYVIRLIVGFLSLESSCYRKVTWFNSPHMSKCPWAKYRTPNWSWCAGRHLAWLPLPTAYECMCESPWVALDKMFDTSQHPPWLKHAGSFGCRFLKILFHAFIFVSDKFYSCLLVSFILKNVYRQNQEQFHPSLF